MWTLDEAVTLCREFEAALSPGFHVALGGSVLYRGDSDKDLDVFVYPHTTELCDWNLARVLLHNFGVRFVRKCEHEYDDKDVREAQYKGKRIDFFFIK